MMTNLIDLQKTWMTFEIIYLIASMAYHGIKLMNILVLSDFLFRSFGFICIQTLTETISSDDRQSSLSRPTTLYLYENQQGHGSDGEPETQYPDITKITNITYLDIHNQTDECHFWLTDSKNKWNKALV